MADLGSDAFEAARANASVTADWDPIAPPPIAGVRLVDVKNVVYKNGVLTEIFRAEWFEDFTIRHVVHVSIVAGETSQWHCHKVQQDVIFPVTGQLRVGL
jgi:dTDP-4-dehydrorhamnose 3,5-epimerase